VVLLAVLIQCRKYHVVWLHFCTVFLTWSVVYMCFCSHLELKFLGFTRKKLSKRSQNARFLEQWNWWNNPPVGGPGIAGILGVPTEMLIDMDESGIIVAAANRRYGHALRGQRAIAQLTVSLNA
jgi:hypothetical protein